MSSVSAGLRPMNTWRIAGSQDRAVSPSAALFVGTVRQPSTVWPSDWMICSNRSSSRRRLVMLRGRNTSPLPYSPGPGSVDARLLAHLLEESRAASAAARRRHRRCSARCRWPRDGRGSSAPASACCRIWCDLPALDVHHEADAARVVLEPGIVQTLLRRTVRAGRPGAAGAVTSLFIFRIPLGVVQRVNGNLGAKRRVSHRVGREESLGGKRTGGRKRAGHAVREPAL